MCCVAHEQDSSCGTHGDVFFATFDMNNTRYTDKRDVGGLSRGGGALGLQWASLDMTGSLSSRSIVHAGSTTDWYGGPAGACRARVLGQSSVYKKLYAGWTDISTMSDDSPHWGRTCYLVTSLFSGAAPVQLNAGFEILVNCPD